MFESHEIALTFGGRAGVLSLDVLESACARPYSGYFRSIHRKSAVLLHGLATTHGFVDGNKRTALLMRVLLLERSGFALVAEPGLHRRFEDLILQLVVGESDLDHATKWFRRRIQRRGGH